MALSRIRVFSAEYQISFFFSFLFFIFFGKVSLICICLYPVLDDESLATAQSHVSMFLFIGKVY